MKTSDSSKQDLVHDFQADLHSLVTTIEQVKKYWEQDREFCFRAIELAAGRTERILETWASLRPNIHRGEDSK